MRVKYTSILMQIAGGHYPGYYQDGTGQSDIDRSCQGEQCQACGRETNRDGTCDYCRDNELFDLYKDGGK